MTEYKIFEIGCDMPRYDENIFTATSSNEAARKYVSTKYADVAYGLKVQRNKYGDGRIVVTNLKNGTTLLYDAFREYTVGGASC